MKPAAESDALPHFHCGSTHAVQIILPGFLIEDTKRVWFQHIVRITQADILCRLGIFRKYARSPCQHRALIGLVNHANARVLRRVCIADFPASVTGTVVHQNQTEVLKGLVQDALDTLPQISLRVIDRDHNTDFLFCRHFLYPSVRAFFLIYAVSSRPAGMHSAVRNGLGDSRT